MEKKGAKIIADKAPGSVGAYLLNQAVSKEPKDATEVQAVDREQATDG